MNLIFEDSFARKREVCFREVYILFCSKRKQKPYNGYLDLPAPNQTPLPPFSLHK